MACQRTSNVQRAEHSEKGRTRSLLLQHGRSQPTLAYAAPPTPTATCHSCGTARGRWNARGHRDPGLTCWSPSSSSATGTHDVETTAWRGRCRMHWWPRICAPTPPDCALGASTGSSLSLPSLRDDLRRRPTDEEQGPASCESAASTANTRCRHGGRSISRGAMSDLLIAYEPAGESEEVPEGLSGPQRGKARRRRDRLKPAQAG